MLTFMYKDEGGGFLGYQIIENGAVTEEKEFEWDSEQGRQLRETLGDDLRDDEDETEEEAANS